MLFPMLCSVNLGQPDELIRLSSAKCIPEHVDFLEAI